MYDLGLVSISFRKYSPEEILFGMKEADLKDFKESVSSGQTALSLNLINWKKNYTDVRIVDQSASGLFEKMSENLLDLL